LRSGEETDREVVEAERPVEKVQIEGGDAKTESSEAGRRQIQAGVAPPERRRY